MKVSGILPVISLIAVFAAFSTSANAKELKPVNLGEAGCPPACEAELTKFTQAVSLTCNTEAECKDLEVKFTSENLECNKCKITINY